MRTRYASWVLGVLLLGLVLPSAALTQEVKEKRAPVRKAKEESAVWTWSVRVSCDGEERFERVGGENWRTTKLELQGKLITPEQGDPVWEEVTVQFSYSGRETDVSFDKGHLREEKPWDTSHQEERTWHVSDSFSLKNFKSGEYREGMPKHLKELWLPNVVIRTVGKRMFGGPYSSRGHPAADSLVDIGGSYPDGVTVAHWRDGETHRVTTREDLDFFFRCPLSLMESEEEQKERMGKAGLESFEAFSKQMEMLEKVMGQLGQAPPAEIGKELEKEAKEREKEIEKTGEEQTVALLKMQGLEEIHPGKVFEGTRTWTDSRALATKISLSWHFGLIPEKR